MATGHLDAHQTPRRMKWRILAVMAVTCLALLVVRQSLSAEPLHYEPAVVELSGRIVIEHHYGPPNYGETPRIDTKVNSPVLHLDAPIAVVGSEQDDGLNSSPFSGVTRVELLEAAPMSLKEFYGKHVTLRGTLFEPVTMHYHTQVVLTLKEVLTVR